MGVQNRWMFVLMVSVLGLFIGVGGEHVNVVNAQTPGGKRLEEAFNRARADLLEGHGEAAAQAFQTILQELESVRMSRELTADEQKIYEWSLDYLGRYSLQAGRSEEAEFYYLTLLQVNPFYEFPDTPPPTVVTYFRNLRRERVGFISLQVEPVDATVYLDQRKVGRGILSAYPAVEGTYQLRIERAGYETWAKVISIKGGGQLKLGLIKLKRVSAAVFVATRPVGVEVYLDGQRVGTTKGPPGDAVRRYAEEHSLPSDEFSDYLPIPIRDNLEHYIEFRLECYDPVSIIVPRTTPDQDLFMEPVVLEPAMGQVTLKVNAEADVYVDGQFKGKASQGRVSICAGSHDITLRNSWSSWSKTIKIARGDRLELKVEMWPKVAFLGWMVEEGASDFAARRSRELLQKVLSDLKRAVWIDFSRADVTVGSETRIGREWGRRVFQLWETGAYDRLKKLLSQLSAATESRLFFLGHIPREDIPRHVGFWLFSDLSGFPDRYTADLTQPGSFKRIADLLNHEEPVLRRVLPFRLAWTHLYPYPLIFRVYQASSSDTQKGEFPDVGSLVYRVGDVKLDSPSALARIRRVIQDRETITVQFGNPYTQKIRNADVTLVETPVELDAGLVGRWFNRIAIGYFRWAERPDAGLAAQIARLNLGLLFMRFQEWSRAFEWLTQARIDRPRGISQPTVQYHMVETYLALGYKADAMKLIDQLKNATRATLGSDLGRSVAEAVRELEAQLK